MNVFKVPTFIPSGLLLIRELIGPRSSPKEADPFPSAPTGSAIQTQDENEVINSPDNEEDHQNQSEEEIAADLMAASSRASTPDITFIRDQELVGDAMLRRGAFGEYSPYGIDHSAPGPSSRPAPIPYDDPYGDAYTASHPAGATGRASAGVGHVEDRQSLYRFASHALSPGGRGFDGRPGGRGRDSRGRGRCSGGGLERGRGRGGGDGDYRGDRQQYDGNIQGNQQRSRYGGGGDATSGDGYNFRSIGSAVPERRSLSPTSFAIARATSHSGGEGSIYPQQHQHQQHHQQPRYTKRQQIYAQFENPRYMLSNGLYAQERFMPQFVGGLGEYINQGYQYPAQGGGGFGMHSMPGVQPHINPRSASVPGSSSQLAPIRYDDPYGDAYTAPDLDELSHPAGATGRAPAEVGRAESRQLQSPYRPTSNASSSSGRGFDGRPEGRGGNSRGRGGGGRERGRGRGSGGDHRGGRQPDDGNMQSNRRRSHYGAGDAAYRDFRSSADPEIRSLSPTSFATARATSHSSGDGIIDPRHQQHEQYHPPQYLAAQNFHAHRYMAANFRVAAVIAESLDLP